MRHRAVGPSCLPRWSARTTQPGRRFKRDRAPSRRMTGASGTPREGSESTERLATSTASDDAEILARLEAVERALTGGETPVADLDGAAELDARLAAAEERVEALADRVDDLDAATQAVRGYAGGIRAVNRRVERRADAALAKAESIERTLAPDRQLRVERLDAAIDSDADAPDDETPWRDGSEDFGRNDGSGDRGPNCGTGDLGQNCGTDDLGPNDALGEFGRDDDPDSSSRNGEDAPDSSGRNGEADGPEPSLAARLRDAL